MFQLVLFKSQRLFLSVASAVLFVGFLPRPTCFFLLSWLTGWLGPKMRQELALCWCSITPNPLSCTSHNTEKISIKYYKSAKLYRHHTGNGHGQWPLVMVMVGSDLGSEMSEWVKIFSLCLGVCWGRMASHLDKHVDTCVRVSHTKLVQFQLLHIQDIFRKLWTICKKCTLLWGN